MSHQFGKCLAWSPSWAHKNNVKRVFDLFCLVQPLRTVNLCSQGSLATPCLAFHHPSLSPNLATVGYTTEAVKGQCVSLQISATVGYATEGAVEILPRLVTPLKGQCISTWISATVGYTIEGAVHIYAELAYQNHPSKSRAVSTLCKLGEKLNAKTGSSVGLMYTHEHQARWPWVHKIVQSRFKRFGFTCAGLSIYLGL